MKKLFTLLSSFALLANTSAQTIWNTGSLTVTKTVPFQQDCITPNVCLTRGSSSVIYNEVSENFLDGDGDCSWTPGNTTWAYGSIANWNTLTYENLYDLHGCLPPSMVNQPMVMHIMPADIYLQLTFSFWGGGGSGGNYTYTRTTGPSPLSVDLTAFTVEAKNNQCILNWATTSETNNSGFDIERSVDGKAFESIQFVPASKLTNGTNTYSFTDQTPNNGVNFYRLKQLDTDGSFNYSWVVNATVNLNVVKVYPNPATDRLTINLTTIGATFQMRDVTGRLVREMEISTNTADVNIADLTAGIYHYSVFNKQLGLIQQGKIAKK